MLDCTLKSFGVCPYVPPSLRADLEPETKTGFTLHESWQTLKRYTHLRPEKVPEK